MAVVTMHRTAWGLDSARDSSWRFRAACKGMDEYTDTLAVSRVATYGSGRQPTQLAYDLAARCRNVCPVLAECTAATEEHRPIGMVQAGLWWPEGQGQPKDLAPLAIARASFAHIGGTR